MTFSSCTKTAWLEAKLNLKSYDIKYKDNQTTGYNMKKLSLKKSYTKCDGETFAIF